MANLVGRALGLFGFALGPVIGQSSNIFIRPDKLSAAIAARNQNISQRQTSSSEI
jgi:hypothetical protein